MTSSNESGYIHPSQLCVGLYVRLELDWLEHPFTFNQFKITKQEQIDTLQSLGLDRIKVDMKRSDAKPLPAPAEPPPPAVVADRTAQDAAIVAKRVRIERLAQHRSALNECERKFQGAARALKAITRNLFARPGESMEEAAALIGGLVDSMLTERDIAIHLMNDKAANEEMYFHQLNVAVLALMLGRQLNMDREQLTELGMGALFHDIGKVELPSQLINKTEPLSPSEQDLMMRHTNFGLDIGKKLGLTPEALAIVFQHHEYVDGSGYPHALSGDGILPLSKLVSIVNEYDNLCNRPNPRDSLTPYEALATMFGQQRKRFDPQALGIFIRCMGVYPPGTLVQLSNNALGLVMSVNASKPLKPTVLIYDPSVPKHEAIILDLETEPDLTIIKSIRPGLLPAPVFAYLNPRKRMTYYCDALPGNPPPN
ncbi:HD-GYP domain-containing protein [Chitinimonas sp. BJYL2]|uniref:HD-GYP domain-containing protein n=1 Tax=Chitinimonas sp. BJYL2 TaxID=2976696 RepID=UPI0022B53532|nr:HD-GYP domain-containing protein [Chitinimonas sp. BJYL2]